jgi:hypothetical protein
VVKSGALLQKILALKNTLAAIFSGYQNSDLIQRFLKVPRKLRASQTFINTSAIGCYLLFAYVV